MAMDNKTVRDAIAIHGTDPQFLIEKILRTRIYECTYWKEQCFGLTESTIIEKAYGLNAIGGQYGIQKPTDFICLVLKLLQLQPREEIVFKYITGLSESDNNKYLRALGAFYLRLTGKPATIYKYLEPLLDDGRKLRKRGMGGYMLTHVDEFVDELLREERVCDVVLPRLVKRHVLEDLGELDPRVSTLETLEMELEEERRAAEQAEGAEVGAEALTGARAGARAGLRAGAEARGDVAAAEALGDVGTAAAGVPEAEEAGAGAGAGAGVPEEDSLTSVVSTSHQPASTDQGDVDMTPGNSTSPPVSPLRHVEPEQILEKASNITQAEDTISSLPTEAPKSLDSGPGVIQVQSSEPQMQHATVAEETTHAGPLADYATLKEALDIHRDNTIRTFKGRSVIRL
ncbi:hypothetical protein BGZ94_010120 [Podila epigama]|nr:hypothetical protein BGZ94_010120 [Podila epigama]